MKQGAFDSSLQRAAHCTIVFAGGANSSMVQLTIAAEQLRSTFDFEMFPVVLILKAVRRILDDIPTNWLKPELCEDDIEHLCERDLRLDKEVSK